MRERCSRRRASRASTATRCGARARSTALLSRFARGEIDVLVGTQMIAKGHDFPARHAGRRHLGRRRARPRRFPGRRADVPAADAGRRPRRPRRAAGRGDRPDALSRTLQHPARVPAGLPGVLRARAAVPAGDALSAAGRADQRGRARRARSPARWTMRRTSSQRLRRARRRGATSACSARRRRRSAGCAASTARSSSSRARTAADARGAAGGDSVPPEIARRTTVDVDPLSVL